MVLKKKTIIILTLAILIVAAGYVTNKYGKALRTNTGKNNTTTQSSKSGVTNDASTAASGYFIDAKLDKDNERTALKQTLTELIDDKSTTAASRKKAEDEIMDMVNRSETEMITENLIKSKDFDDAVVFISDNNVNVTVRAKELKADQVGVIKNIVCRATGVNASKITIQAKE